MTVVYVAFAADVILHLGILVWLVLLDVRTRELRRNLGFLEYAWRESLNDFRHYREERPSDLLGEPSH